MPLTYASQHTDTITVPDSPPRTPQRRADADSGSFYSQQRSHSDSHVGSQAVPPSQASQTSIQKLVEKLAQSSPSLSPSVSPQPLLASHSQDLTPPRTRAVSPARSASPGVMIPPGDSGPFVTEFRSIQNTPGRNEIYFTLFRELKGLETKVQKRLTEADLMHAKRRKLEETKPQSHLDFAKIQLSLLQKRCGTEFAALGVRRKEIFDAEHEFRKLKEAVESSESELDELKAAVQTTLAELEEAEEKKQAADRALAAAKLLDSSSAAMIPATKTRIDAAQIRLAEVEVHKVSEETTINGLVGELARAKRQNVLHKQLAEKRARFGGS